MNIEILYRPSYAMARVSLAGDEKIQAEGGAMLSKDSHVTIETHRSNKGAGLLKSLTTAFLGGESFWMNTFTAAGKPGEVTIAPTLPVISPVSIFQAPCSYSHRHIWREKADCQLTPSFRGSKDFSAVSRCSF
jgi:hypothetical protein